MSTSVIAINNLALGFEYTNLAESDVSLLESKAETIVGIIEQTRKSAAESILRVGKELAEVHFMLAGRGRDGMFRPWVKERCGFSCSTATRALAAYEIFGKCVSVTHLFEASALYLLSAESCPEDATKEAIRRAKKGEQITAKVAREIKASHTPDESLPSVDEEYQEQKQDKPFDSDYESNFVYSWNLARWDKWPATSREALSKLYLQLSKECK